MSQMHKKGFTIIELTLSMAFISTLLLAIVMASIHAGSIYNKGIVMESVNQAGRDIGDTLRRDFLQTNTGELSPVGDGMVILVKEGERVINGRFCLSGYSYLWNGPTVISPGSDHTAPPANAIIRHNGRPVNFVRVADSGRSLCGALPSGGYPNDLGTRQVTHLLKQTDGSVSLSIHNLEIDRLAGAEALFSLRYTIGTSQTSEINTASQSCRPPSDDAANDSFCAINEFESIVRANG